MNRQEFLSLFAENTEKRSRTSAGVGETSISPAKMDLLKAGDDLKRQVRENTLTLAEEIWETPGVHMDASLVRSFLESWFDTIHTDILERNANKYRLWEASYAHPEKSPPPEYLGVWMDVFYAEIVKKMILTDGKSVKSVAILLAWADREMDLVIHPWSDGCGRMSTALVMWLALQVSEVGFPKFSKREEHYTAMKTAMRHTEYFLKCLKP
ncbi:MAG: hypothetical protein HYT94_02380 [Parcubacteria group bacterium]|nr:hypothetical protein [Parcubacteria group bacterium]